MSDHFLKGCSELESSDMWNWVEEKSTTSCESLVVEKPEQ